MEQLKQEKKAIRLPLFGLTLAWVFFVGAAFYALFLDYPEYDNLGNYVSPDPIVQLDTYLYLLGVSALAVCSLLGQRLSLRLRETKDSLLARGAQRFTTLSVIISLVAGAIYAVGTFLGAFNNYSGRDATPLVRIFGVYVPIILATALVVIVLLFAFVFRQDAPDLPHAEKDQERSKLQRAIGLAYASPIIGTAIAIIFGLVVYDTTKTNLDVWIWVVIQVIIVASILIGTNFAVRARLSKPVAPRPKTSGAAAININLVLSIIFGVAVSAMAFSYGMDAVSALREWPEPVYKEDVYIPQDPIIRSADLAWIMGKLLPALALLALAEVGIYQSIILRNSKPKERNG